MPEMYGAMLPRLGRLCAKAAILLTLFLSAALLRRYGGGSSLRVTSEDAPISTITRYVNGVIPRLSRDNRGNAPSSRTFRDAKDAASSSSTSRDHPGAAPSCTVTVMTMNRVKSLRRLLASLENSDYGGDSVHLQIKVDHSKDNSGVIALAESFNFSHGEKTVEVAKENKGLRQAWFDAWRPRDGADCGIILEDDLEVARPWYKWLKAAWRSYGRRHDVAGVTLSRQTSTQKIPTRQFEIVNDHKPFLNANFGTQGFSPHPQNWIDFLDWIKTIDDLDTVDVAIPGLLSTVWWRTLPKRDDWGQYFKYFNKKRGLYTLFINLPNKETLTANWREKGTHFSKALGFDFKLAENVSLEFPTDLKKYGFDGNIESPN